MYRAILAALAALSLQACGKKPPPQPLAEAPTAVKPKVTVLNADVLVIGGEHYRLANAYAPQQVPDAHCWGEATAAKQATRVVAAMVERAARVEADPTGAKDDYNRHLATIRLDGADLGDLLFKDGLAAHPPTGRFEWCQPVSRDAAGSPNVLSMTEVAPGLTPAH
jgi:hypothetical protein